METVVISIYCCSYCDISSILCVRVRVRVRVRVGMHVCMIASFLLIFLFHEIPVILVNCDAGIYCVFHHIPMVSVVVTLWFPGG